MPNLNPLTNIWTIVKEADLRPLRESAEHPLRIAVIGRPGTGRSLLAEKLRRDPARPGIGAFNTPVLILDLDAALQATTPTPAVSSSSGQPLAPHAAIDLAIVMISADRTDTQAEQELVRRRHAAGVPSLVFINYAPLQLATGTTAPSATSLEAASTVAPSTRTAAGTNPASIATPLRARSRGVVRGSMEDPVFMAREFAPAVIELIPDRVLALGRSFPFFRVPVAQYLINDTSFSNAAYAFSTALAEMTAVLNVPIALTDMIVLTKNQLFLVYKLGLALGFSTRWQDYVTEFGGVLGGGFLFRQVARTLVGMVPVWGIIPKTAISYAGTYAIGSAVLQWYLTGRQLEPGQIKHLYSQALGNGKALARRLLRRKPRLKAPGENQGQPRGRLRLPIPRRKQPALPDRAAAESAVCPECGRSNAPDARFCQYCGHVFLKT